MVAQSLPAKTETRAEPTERTDDPVRMYLREMGSVELLSREGEIAIAKRIEAGREAMIAGLCESPLTFQAIIIWRDELNEGKILLRDIIDLEATYEGPEAKAVPPVVPIGAAASDRRSRCSPHAAAAQANGEDGARRRAPPEGEMDEDDEYENALSLAAMEAELKPKVLETFDNIAAHLQEAAQAAGQEARAAGRRRAGHRARSRRPTTSCAKRSSRTSRASRSTTTASRAWSSSSTRSTSA